MPGRYTGLRLAEHVLGGSGGLGAAKARGRSDTASERRLAANCRSSSSTVVACSASTPMGEADPVECRPVAHHVECSLRPASSAPKFASSCFRMA